MHHARTLAVLTLAALGTRAPETGAPAAHHNQDRPGWAVLEAFWKQAWDAPFVPGRSSMLLAGQVVIACDTEQEAPVGLGWFDAAARRPLDAGASALSLEQRDLAAGLITASGGLAIPVLATVDAVDGLEVLTPVRVTGSVAEAVAAFDAVAAAFGAAPPRAAHGCDAWRELCGWSCFDLHEGWRADCGWSVLPCLIRCARRCTPWCLMRCIGGCIVEHGRCRREALEFLIDCYTACVEARGCDPFGLDPPPDFDLAPAPP